MTLLAPLWLLPATAAAAAVVVLHFLARQRPRAMPLPTARFVPDLPAHAPSRATRPTDLVVLIVRAAALLAIGAALAGPRLTPDRRPVARVVAVDLSRAVGSRAEAADSALARYREGDALVMFDSTARLVADGQLDTLRALRASPDTSHAPGSLSAALIASVRAAAPLAERAESLELVVVSPLVREEWDAATAAVRRQWRGAARLVQVAPAAAPAPGRITVDGPPDDPLRATVALLGGIARSGVRQDLAIEPSGAARAAAETRLLRRAITAADSVWAHTSGGALLVWPVESATSTDADTVGAVVTAVPGGEPIVVVAPFTRIARALDGRAVAHWLDGVPAAVERPLGAGCRRDVAIGVPAAGDLVLRASFARLVAKLAEPCGGRPDLARLPDSTVATLRGGERLLAASAVPTPTRAGAPPAARWLFVLAAALLVLELVVRSAGGARQARA
jgi:hypothetical protein